MTLHEQAGPLGAAITGTTGMASIIAQATPVLQFVLLLVSITVGVLTALWYVKRLRGKE